MCSRTQSCLSTRWRACAGYSLVEALLACALLGLALIPAMAAFRAQAVAIERMALRQRVDRAVEERLARAEARLRLGRRDAPPSGFVEPGLMVLESPPEATPCGPCTLWRVVVSGRAVAAGYEAAAEGWLLLPPAKPGASP